MTTLSIIDTGDAIDMLKLDRRALGLTQDDIAGIIGVSRTTVARWESHLYPPPIHNLIAYAEAVGYNLTVNLTKRKS